VIAIAIGVGRDGPLGTSPQERIAPAKPALERRTAAALTLLRPTARGAGR
jgi:hypothetical protein